MLKCGQQIALFLVLRTFLSSSRSEGVSLPTIELDMRE